jgi:hypothetical protein
MADDSEGDNGIVDEYDNDKNIDSSQKLNDARKFIKQHTRHVKVTISPTFYAFQRSIFLDSNDNMVPIGPKINHNYLKPQRAAAIMNALLDDVCEQNPEDERVLQDDQRCLAHWCEKV